MEISIFVVVAGLSVVTTPIGASVEKTPGSIAIIVDRVSLYFSIGRFVLLDNFLSSCRSCHLSVFILHIHTS